MTYIPHSDLTTPLTVGQIFKDKHGSSYKVLAVNSGGYHGVLHYIRANVYDIMCVKDRCDEQPSQVGKTLFNICSTVVARTIDLS